MSEVRKELLCIKTNIRTSFRYEPESFVIPSRISVLAFNFSLLWKIAVAEVPSGQLIDITTSATACRQEGLSPVESGST